MNDDLIKKNIPLIYYVIKKMGLYHKCEEYFDLGLIALVTAKKTFDETKGYTFKTYAGVLIKNEILKQIQTENCIKRKTNYLSVSIYEPINDDETIMLLDTISNEVDIENDFEKKQQKELIYKIISILDERDRFIMKHYFGLQGCEEFSQQKIAKILKISQTTVRNRIKRSIKIIRKVIENEKEN